MDKKLIQHELDKFVSPVDSNSSYSAVRTAGATTTSPAVGQLAVSVTGTAVQLPDNSLLNGAIISADSGNTDDILIGGSGVTNTSDGTGNGYVLAPGGAVSFAVTNTNVLYINGTANDFISYAGS